VTQLHHYAYIINISILSVLHDDMKILGLFLLEFGSLILDLNSYLYEWVYQLYYVKMLETFHDFNLYSPLEENMN
jgi:hypothetical protein